MDIDRLKERYLNKTIKINHLFDEDKAYDGKVGEVTKVDSLGALHGTWGTLSVLPQIDDFSVIDSSENSVQLVQHRDMNIRESQNYSKQESYIVTIGILNTELANKIQNAYDVDIKTGRNKFQIVIPDFDTAIKVLQVLEEGNAFEKAALTPGGSPSIQITKISKNSLNDSVINENAEACKTFITEYIYSVDDREAVDTVGRTLDDLEMAAAQVHCRFLKSKGLDVDIRSGRWSTKIYVTYCNAEQYEALKLWLAWHLGYTDNILKKLNPEDDREIAEIIASGKSTLY